MGLTIFLLIVVGIGGGIILFSRLSEGTFANLRDEWFDSSSRAKVNNRRRKKQKKATSGQARRAELKQKKQQEEKNKWRAISLKCGEHPCAAARRMEGKRALVLQFPRIPLSTCDAEVCKCTFEHHEDRRSGKERREILNSLQNENRAKFKGFKARSGKDRRKNSGLEDDLKTLNISYD